MGKTRPECQSLLLVMHLYTMKYNLKPIIALHFATAVSEKVESDAEISYKRTKSKQERCLRLSKNHHFHFVGMICIGHVYVLIA